MVHLLPYSVGTIYSLLRFISIRPETSHFNAKMHEKGNYCTKLGFGSLLQLGYKRLQQFVAILLKTWYIRELGVSGSNSRWKNQR